jgi:transposase-like protein
VQTVAGPQSTLQDQGEGAGDPAEHWIHLRTTNPIESTFATVRLRTKGVGSRAAALGMVFKLIESAQERWRP